MAANRAFLAGIGLSPAAMQEGLVAPLQLEDPLCLEAARRLAKQATIATAEWQVRMSMHACACLMRLWTHLLGLGFHVVMIFIAGTTNAS